MKLRVLNVKEIEEVYNQDMQRDFPKEEIKPLKTILELVRQGYYQCYGCFENKRLCAYLFFVWEHKDLTLLDYFAVIPEFRRQGAGGKALALIRQEFSEEGFWGILFEIERISLAVNEEQKRVRTNRKKFYLQNGCMETGLESKIFGVGYELLYLPVEEKQINGKSLMIEEKNSYASKQYITKEMFRKIEKAYTEIYHRMVKKEYLEENVMIHVD